MILKAYNIWIKFSLIVLLILGMTAGVSTVNAQGYHDSIPEVCNPSTGGSSTVTHALASSAIGAGTLTMYYNGDGSASSEYIDVYSEGGTFLGTLYFTAQCASSYDVATISLSQTDISNWAADGNIEFTYDASNGVNSICSGNSFCIVSVLDYPSAGGFNDAGVASVDDPSNFCAGTESINVTISNFGINQIDSLTINWSFNGNVETPIKYTSMLDTFNGSGSYSTQITLGTKTFTSGKVDTLVVWTSSPNGGQDTVTINDTATKYLQPALNGNFTIGTSGSADYSTFSAAVQDLVSYGVCGPVHFQVESGTFNEQVTIPEIKGASGVNTITFEGAGMANTTLQYSATSSTNRVTLLLDGADHITFKNMKIEATGSSYGYTVLLTGAADSNTFDACRIETSTTSSSSNFQAIVASSSTTSYSGYGNNANYTTVQNCEIRGGYNAIRFNGTSTTNGAKGNRFINNHITDYYYYGMYIYYSEDYELIGNTIIHNRGNSFADGIYFYYGVNFRIESNIIDVHDYGIYVYYGNYYLSGSAVFANNLIVSSGDYAARLYRSYDVDIYYNTLVGNYGLYLYYPQNSKVLNNIFHNTSTSFHYAFYSNDPSGVEELDHNVYYSNGYNLAYYSGAYSTLSAWQSAYSDINEHSVEADPMYANTTNLNYEPTNPVIDNIAIKIPGINFDVVGNPRCTPPDPGAFENTMPRAGNDLGIFSLDSMDIFCGGTQNIYITVQNFGKTQVSSFTVDWTVNGSAQTPTTFNIPLDSSCGAGASSATVMVGSWTFTPGTPFDIKIWSTPGSGADTANTNDTLETTLQAALSGNLTIGGSSSDYPTIDSAVSSLKMFGVCAPVVFNIEPGTYNEQIEITEITGASAVNTITFDGADSTQVTLTYTGNGSTSDWITLLMNGADHITFKNMTIEGGHSSYAAAVFFTNQADSNTFESCIIKTQEATSSYSVAVLASSSVTSNFGYGNNANYNTIQNCWIGNGYYGIRWNGESSSSSTSGNVGNAFIGNTIENYYYYGMYMYRSYQLHLEGNTIKNGRYASAGYGLYVYYPIEVNIINNNSEDHYGLRLYYAGYYGSGQTSTVEGNKFVATGSYNYIYRATNVEFYNNVFVSESNYGIYMGYAGSSKFYHNTVVGEPAYYSYYPQSIDIQNNIFYSEGDHAFYIYNSTGYTNLDYNLYYTGGNELIDMGGTIFNDLASWQASLPGTNQNSVVGNPFFVGPDDYHAEGPYAHNKGNSLGVAFDMDGESRDPNTPDIGADEYTLPPIDLSTITLINPVTKCELTDIEKVQVYLMFMGTDTLPAGEIFDISYQVNGGAIVTESITLIDTLTVLDSVYYSFAAFADLSAYGEYEVKVWPDLPADGKASNDTLTLSVFNSLVTNYPYIEDFETFGPLTSVSSCQNSEDGMKNGWLQSDDDGGNWNVWAGPTPDKNTGPIVDFDPGTYDGKYLTTISTSYTCLGYEYIVQTPCFNLGNLTNPGMNFAYNMWGSQMGALHVDIVTDTGVIQDIWMASGNKGAEWQQTAISLKQYQNLGTIKFQFRSAPYYYDSDIAIDDFRLGELPVVEDDSLTACGSVTLNAGNPGATYEWSTGGTGQTETIIAGDVQQKHVVTVAVTGDNGSGLINWGTTKVTLNPGPYVDLGPDEILVCDQDPYTLDAGNPGMTYFWSTNETTQQIQVPIDGQYTVEVTDQNNCIHSDTIVIELEQSPTASFVAIDDTFSNLVTFNSGGSYGDTYHWDFGDGVFSTKKNPQHWFNTQGYHEVTLVVTNECGSDTLVQEVYNEERGVGLDEIESLSRFQIYPNPTEGLFVMNIEAAYVTDIEITILNVQGQMIDYDMLEDISSTYSKEYDLSQFAKGIYFVKIQTVDDSVTQKLVIQ